MTNDMKHRMAMIAERRAALASLSRRERYQEIPERPPFKEGFITLASFDGRDYRHNKMQLAINGALQPPRRPV